MRNAARVRQTKLPRGDALAAVAVEKMPGIVVGNPVDRRGETSR